MNGLIGATVYDANGDKVGIVDLVTFTAEGIEIGIDIVINFEDDGGGGERQKCQTRDNPMTPHLKVVK